MAKGNYQSTYATAQPRQNNISDWIIQQEKMNLFMDKYQKDLIKDAEEKKAKAQEAAKKRLDEVGFGKAPDFKLTGTEALDYNVRLLSQEAMNENFKLDQEIKAMEQSGELDIFKMAELKQKKDLLFKLPENLAAAQQKYQQEVTAFQQGLQEGTILPTPENLARLKKMQDGEYKLALNPDNYAEFSVVFDKDGDGVEDFIPFSDFVSDKSIGKKVQNFNLRGEALKVAEQIGTLEHTGYEGFYKVTTEGLKYDDEQLYTLLSSIADNSPGQLESFAYQKYGKFADQLETHEKEQIIREFMTHVKSAINEKHKDDFDSGLAGHNLAEREFGYKQKRDEIEDGQWWAKFNQDAKQNDDSTPRIISQDYVDDSDSTGKEFKSPTYGVGGNYEIVIDKQIAGIQQGGKVKIKVNAIKAYPLKSGGFNIKASDGTTEYLLNESELAQLKNIGITREKIRQDYNALNAPTKKPAKQKISW